MKANIFIMVLFPISKIISNSIDINMNSQDKADLKKYKELKEQRNMASKKYNASHTDDIRTRRVLKNQMNKTTEVKDLSTSLVKAKPIKPVKEPIKLRLSQNQLRQVQ